MIKDFGSIEKGIAFLETIRGDQEIAALIDLQVLYNLIGEEEKAFEVSNKLMKLAPNDPRVLFNRGWHRMSRGDIIEGFSLLESGRLLNSYGDPLINSPLPILKEDSSISPYSKVLLYGEGGFGDEIIALRFAKHIHDKFKVKPIFACQRSLLPLVNQQDYVSLGLDKEFVLGCYHDYWLPAMSSVFYLGEDSLKNLDSPYVELKKVEQMKQWKNLIREKTRPNTLKVGLRWSGSSHFEHKEFRDIKTKELQRLLKVKGVTFFSFQKGDSGEGVPDSTVNLDPLLKDWSDSFSALAQMDLVISSCTSVAHAAASMGRPTWVLVPTLPYFIWAEPGSKSRWYKSVRLFRQKEFGSWEATLEDVASSLEEERK